MSSVLLDTHDLGEAEEVLSATYSQLRFSTPPGAVTNTRMERSQVGSLISDRLSYSYDVDLEADPMAEVVLCRMTSGVITQMFARGRVETCGRGEVMAVGGIAGVDIAARMSTPAFDTVVLQRHFLGQVAAPRPGVGESDGIRLTSTRAISADADALLGSAIEYVRRTMHGNADAIDQPLVASTVGRFLAATILTAYPNTALVEPTIEDRHDSTPVLLRRAMAFIDDHAADDVSLVDIAQAVYVTPRALQYMFRKHRDCTPMEYLRRVRLDYARRDLLAGDRTRTTVGQVAAKWGFGHLGRFAVYYRRTYGESPYQTLRR